MSSDFEQLQAAAQGGRLRRHAGRADALDRPAGARQPRAGRQAAAASRAASRSTCSRWTGRRWSRAAPRRSRPSEGGWNVFLTSWVAADVLNPISTAGLNASCENGAGSAGRATSSSSSCATGFAQRDRSGQADRARRPDPGARARGRHPRLRRPVVPADRAPQERHGPAARPGAVLLERRARASEACGGEAALTVRADARLRLPPAARHHPGAG